MSEGRWHEWGSSYVEAGRFDPDEGGTTGTLRLRFKGGFRCRYAGVERGVWDGLLAAGSKGVYFHAAIRGRPYVPE